MADIVIGWTWDVDLDATPPPCAACVAMAGTEHDLSEDLDSHPGCRCQKQPILAAASDLANVFGVTLIGAGILEQDESADDSNEQQSGAAWFDKQDTATQRAVLGSDAALQLYRSGVPLQRFVGTKNGTIYQKSAKQVQAEKKGK